MRGNFLPGQRIEGGKNGHLRGLLTRERLVEELHRCGKSFRARARCDDDHNGPAKFRGDLSSDQSLGSIGESGHMLTREFMRNPATQSRNRGFEGGMPAHRRQSFRDRG